MSIQTIDPTNRAQVPADGDTHPATNVTRGSGRREVAYRTADGKTFSAIVIGPGSVSGLMLEVPALRHNGGTHILNNVPAATTMKSVEAYFDHYMTVINPA